MNIENELIKLKNQMDSKIDGLLEIYKNNNKVESEPTERDGEYFDVNINLLNNNNIIKELIVYPTIQCMNYIYFNTNRVNICNFTLDDMILSCGYTPHRSKGRSNDTFNNMLTYLSNNNIIRGFKLEKPNNLNKISLNEAKNIKFFKSDYEKIFNNHSSNGVVCSRMLYVYAFLLYCNENKIEMSYGYIVKSTGLHLRSVSTYLKSFKELGLDKYIPSTYSDSESLIANIFTKNNIKFESEKRFKDDSVKYKPFDFYIKDLNLIIEYDGEHHFQPVRFGGMSEEKAIENFIKTKENDEIKNQYCKDNGIDLLRIPYTEKDNIESIIINKLNSIKSIN